MRIVAQICVLDALHQITFYNNACVDQLAQRFQLLGILCDASEIQSTRDWRWRWWWRCWRFDTITCRGLIGIDIEDIYVQTPIMLMRRVLWDSYSGGNCVQPRVILGATGDTNDICWDILCASDFQETPHHGKSTFPMFPMLVFDKNMLNRCAIAPLSFSSHRCITSDPFIETY